MSARSSKTLVPALIAGAVVGVAGALMFALAHALLIVPIWGRMTSGILFGLAAGVAAGWALAEIHPAVVQEWTARGALAGARFGALLWLAAAPVTAVDAVLRALGLTSRYEVLAVVIALVIAISDGLLLGWVTTHRRLGAIAGAAAVLLLVVAMAGPVPIGRSARAVNIFLAVLPIAVLAGLALTLLAPWIYARISRPATGDSVTIAD
jgi:hypothetical protein